MYPKICYQIYGGKNLRDDTLGNGGGNFAMPPSFFLNVKIKTVLGAKNGFWEVN